jgi:hypothetical protein
MKKNLMISTLVLTSSFLGFFLGACCYRMPEEHEYCVIPRTNNPDLIRERPSSPAPSVKY